MGPPETKIAEIFSKSEYTTQDQEHFGSSIITVFFFCTTNFKHPSSHFVFHAPFVYLIRTIRARPQILKTRERVKRRMKDECRNDGSGGGGDPDLERLLNSRQFGLKLIANVTCMSFFALSLFFLSFLSNIIVFYFYDIVITIIFSLFFTLPLS